MTTSRTLAVYDPNEIEKLPDPWLRQPGEPDDAWVAFQEYRDQRLPRAYFSIRKRHQTVTDWARDWSWAARAAAFDNMRETHMVQERLAALSVAAKELGARDATLLMRAYDLLNSEVEKLLTLSESKDFEQTSVMKPTDLIKLAELVMKMKRLSQGEATENVAVVAQTFGANLTDQERLDLWELSKKAGA